MKKQTSTVYHLKKHVNSLIHEDSAESYSRIHPFMVLFASQNPNAVVALDRDSENHFYRCFMSLPVASYACGVQMNYILILLYAVVFVVLIVML